LAPKTGSEEVSAIFARFLYPKCMEENERVQSPDLEQCSRSAAS